MERRRAGKAGKRARRVVGVCGRGCGKAGKGAEDAGEDVRVAGKVRGSI